MEDEGKIKEAEMSKFRMILKLMRLFLWTARKRTWFLPELTEITVDELHDLMVTNSDLPLLIDTRGEKGFTQAFDMKGKKLGHIPNSQPIGLRELISKVGNLPKETQMVTICPRGGMSLVAVDVLVNAGFEDVRF